MAKEVEVTSVHIEAMFGPYRGQRLKLSPEDAAAAIADGWARDPNKPNPIQSEAQYHDPEKVTAATAAAEAAARKFRGEPEPGETEDPAAAPKPGTKPAPPKPAAKPVEPEGGNGEPDPDADADAGSGPMTTDDLQAGQSQGGTYQTRRGRPPKS